MKKSMITAAVVSAALIASQAHADDKDDNQDACGAVLCLAGLMTGSDGGESCRKYDADYFSIVRFHHGHFDLSGTANARSDFLDQCQSAGGDVKGAVNSKYGTVQYGP
ncbi:TrbM/KikA/MpfK family conjugal transfer protein [Robbsia andropogonis]|uniref:TrbM/KikA/MpfK family conjugal transfer protein n=1 Tax=Robbsia andropogonis TaxID=28092 RepID=UPI00055D424E|nr:TrbM/KikA/MpfK family conjugal transfer protein [Robbsia andropogonis]